MLVGLPVASLVYIYLCRHLDLKHELEQIRVCRRNLERGRSSSAP